MNTKQEKNLLKLVLALFLMVTILGISAPVLALETPGAVQSALGSLPTDLSPEHRLATIVNWLLGIAATVAVLLIVISGIRYIVSAGNQQEIDDAKKTITYAVIGLVITILAIVIVNVVIRIIGD